MPEPSPTTTGSPSPGPATTARREPASGDDGSPEDSASPDRRAWMGLALAEARLAAEKGETPVGAVVVIDGEIVTANHNRREATNDPSAHAELLALRDACSGAGSWRLPGATVVVTLEPCAMCAGALSAARVARVIFGAPDPKTGALGSLYNLGVDPRLPHTFEVIAGVEADECGDLLRDFFADRR